MQIERFEDLEVWKCSKDLTIFTMRHTSRLSDFSFKNQIQRAVVSVMNNIAEGFERQTTKECLYFLYVSKGSCGEVRSMTYLAEELGYLAAADSLKIRKDCVRISVLLYRLISSLKQKKPYSRAASRER